MDAWSLNRGESSKSESAYTTIKDLIMKGRLTRDDTVSVSLLASKLEMSKTPVRDALQKLESEGFVRIIPNQGVVVCDLTVGEANYMYELRIALEGTAMGLTARILKSRGGRPASVQLGWIDVAASTRAH